MNNPNKNEVYIKINPDQMAQMMPEAVKKSVARRAASAGNREQRRRIITLFLLAASVVITLAVGAFADTMAPSDLDNDIPVQVLQVYNNGIGPWDISDGDMDLVKTAAMSSARGEGKLAMQAVAQCIRNTCEAQGLTVEECIAKYRYPMNYQGVISSDCEAAVLAVVSIGTQAINDDIHYFYNPKVQDGSWHESMNYVCSIGDLRFFN